MRLQVRRDRADIPRRPYWIPRGTAAQACQLHGPAVRAVRGRHLQAPRRTNARPAVELRKGHSSRSLVVKRDAEPVVRMRVGSKRHAQRPTGTALWHMVGDSMYDARNVPSHADQNDISYVPLHWLNRPKMAHPGTPNAKAHHRLQQGA